VGQPSRTSRRFCRTINEPVDVLKAAFGNTPAHNVQASRNPLQEIVEIMRDAAGKLTNGLHFLRLTQSFFRSVQCTGPLFDTRFQRTVQGLQGSFRFAALDHLAGPVGDLLHKLHFMRLPGASGTVVEVDDGAEAARAQKWHNKD
jgi:hypothetical protein